MHRALEQVPLERYSPLFSTADPPFIMIDSSSLDECLERFEQAWQQGETPDLVAFWAACPERRLSAGESLACLCELIKLDLEFRWSRLGGALGLLEDYRARFPELGPLPEWPADLIVEEWRARRRWGDRPAIGDYLLRFPEMEELAAGLQRAEEEMGREWREPPAADSATRAARGPDPRAPLDYRDFMLNEFVGGGGMGKVYRAWNKSQGKTVAVKMLRKSRWGLPGAVDRFLAEAEVLTRLRHPGIIGIHGAGRTPGGGLFLVMDWIDGENLEELALAFPPSPAQIAAWIAEAAAALDHAHRQGIVHCDLKPSNLLRERTGQVIVGDFGLATGLHAGAETCRLWAGTVGYMAPEQFHPEFGSIGPATDIFALGLTVLRLLTGETAFQGRLVVDSLFGREPDKNRWPESAFTAAVPMNFRGVLTGCLALEPAARIQTARELAEVLRQWPGQDGNDRNHH